MTLCVAIAKTQDPIRKYSPYIYIYVGSEWIRAPANLSMFHGTVQSDWSRKPPHGALKQQQLKQKKNANKLDLARLGSGHQITLST